MIRAVSGSWGSQRREHRLPSLGNDKSHARLGVSLVERVQCRHRLLGRRSAIGDAFGGWGGALCECRGRTRDPQESGGEWARERGRREEQATATLHARLMAAAARAARRANGSVYSARSVAGTRVDVEVG